MLFDDFVVLDCDDINIESSTEGKEEKKRVWTKEKMMKRIRCCVIGVFGSQRMHSCVKNEKQVSVWIRRE